MHVFSELTGEIRHINYWNSSVEKGIENANISISVSFFPCLNISLQLFYYITEKGILPEQATYNGFAYGADLYE